MITAVVMIVIARAVVLPMPAALVTAVAVRNIGLLLSNHLNIIILKMCVRGIE